MVQARLMQVPEYRQMFREIFGQIPNQDAIERAVATFERYELATKPEGYPFGRYMLGDDKALSDAQKRGMQLFAGKARCILCHNGEIGTDEDHHNTGVPRPANFENNPLSQVEVRQRMRGAGISNFMEVDDELALYMRTHRTPDKHKLRTQPLLEWKYTAPYMHNGAFFTMEEVVDFYNAGGGEDRYHNKSPLLKPLNLTDAEKADLVAFLDSLNSEELPGLKEFGNPKLPGYGTTSTIAGIN
jgi:cytochrome c peroxidase